jgi:Leucine-rich repeat (LRR) protein
VAAATRLAVLHADNCRLFDQAVVSSVMPALVVLSLRNNAMFSFPETCSVDGESLFPKLQKFLFTDTMIETLDESYCLPSLKDLDLSNSHISQFKRGMFETFPNLTRLVANNVHVKKIEDYAFRHPTLQLIGMTYSYLSLKVVGRRVFAGSPRLEYVRLDHCLLGSDDIYSEMISDTLSFIPTLKHLFLVDCNIRAFSKNTFNRLHGLETLHLYRNRLTDLPDHLINLTDLSLSHNELKIIGENVFSEETRKRLVKLDLSGNKFTCDCSVLWFKRWLLSFPHLFSASFSRYLCANDPGVPVSGLILPEQACYFSQETYKFLTATLAIS